MNITPPLEHGIAQVNGILSKDDHMIAIVVILSFLVSLSITGMVTNFINVKTFIAMGLDDGVTLSFLALSINDLCYTAVSLAISASGLCSIIETTAYVIFPIQPVISSMFTVVIGMIFCNITGMITIYLAVARCICVSQPLHFKNVFTKARSIYLHILFPVLVTACYVPVLSQTGTQYAFDAKVNLTRTILWISSSRGEIKNITFLVVDNIFTFTVQITMVVCVLVMTHYLQKSLKFRESFKTVDGGNNQEGESKLSGKELQVVKQVVLICAIYIICVMPEIFISIFSMVEPEFNIGKRFHRVYGTINLIRTAFEIFNSASTFPIYYSHNSKFRSFFK